MKREEEDVRLFGYGTRAVLVCKLRDGDFLGRFFIRLINVNNLNHMQWESQRLSAPYICRGLLQKNSSSYHGRFVAYIPAHNSQSRILVSCLRSNWFQGRSVGIWVTGGSIRRKMGRAINRLIMIDWLDWIGFSLSTAFYIASICFTHIVYINNGNALLTPDNDESVLTQISHRRLLVVLGFIRVSYK